MDLRQTLFALAAEHGVAADARLQAAAGLQGEPAAVRHRGPFVLRATAATLVGLGLVFWVAANWDTLGRAARFGLLQGLLLLALAGAAMRPAARAAFSLLAWLVTGGLLACFGQIYQTGADPWQLFALWALLTLPLALAARSDLVWVPWVLVAMVAVSLWTQAHAGHRWRTDADTLPLFLQAWGATLALPALLSPAAARWTGAGPWALRTAITLAVVAITVTALGALFGSPVHAHYGLGLVVLLALTWGLARPATVDLHGLSVAWAGLDTLLVCGLARWLFHGSGGDTAGKLLVLGVAAAVLVAASVASLLRRVRQARTTERPA